MTLGRERQLTTWNAVTEEEQKRLRTEGGGSTVGPIGPSSLEGKEATEDAADNPEGGGKRKLRALFLDNGCVSCKLIKDAPYAHSSNTLDWKRCRGIGVNSLLLYRRSPGDMSKHSNDRYGSAVPAQVRSQSPVVSVPA